MNIKYLRIAIRLIDEAMKMVFEVFLIIIPINDNKLVFLSKPDYYDNAKILSDYIQKYNKYEVFWLMNNHSIFEQLSKENPGLNFVKYHNKISGARTFRSIYIIYTSSVIFHTHGFQRYFKKNRQIEINLWHGCGFKRQKNGDKTKWSFDYVLVPGNLFIETKSTFFNCEKSRILPIGYPRYNNLIKSEFNEVILKKINHQKYSKTIIWLPTFRDDKTNSENLYDQIPIIDDYDQLASLNEFCKRKNLKIIIKLHKNIINSFKSKLTNVEIISNDYFDSLEVDLYTMLVYCDALITDYSSVSFDYLLLDRPIGYTLDDYEYYKRIRGYVFDSPLDYMPGHKLYNITDLYAFIGDIYKSKDIFKEDRKRIKNISIYASEDYCKELLEKLDLI